MRAWKMTAGLALAAVLAALVAPRLFGSAPQQPRVCHGPSEPGQMVSAPSTGTLAPETPVIAESPMHPAGGDGPPAIPELDVIPEPPAVPTPPDPKLDEAWLDMVDCGMG